MLQVSHETALALVFILQHKSALRMKFEAREEGEDDARSACPFDTLGYTHNTMTATTRSDEATLS